MNKCIDCGISIDADYKHKSLCRRCNGKRSSNYYYNNVRNKIPGIDLKDKDKESRNSSKSSGDKRYLSVQMCIHGHTGERLVSTQQCCECLRLRKLSQRKMSKKERMALKQNNLRRTIAKNMGQDKFKSALECPSGHLRERYTASGQCCDCMKVREPRGSKSPGPVYANACNEHKNRKRRSKKSRLKNRIYYRESLSKCDNFKMTRFMRGCLRRCLVEKGGKRTYEVIGYTTKDLKARLETNFKPGMSWDNYGQWHIDHAKPISRFLSQGVSDPKTINSLCNLRPEWAKDNLSKGAAFES